jgi:hypothetical protein
MRNIPAKNVNTDLEAAGPNHDSMLVDKRAILRAMVTDLCVKCRPSIFENEPSEFEATCFRSVAVGSLSRDLDRG